MRWAEISLVVPPGMDEPAAACFEAAGFAGVSVTGAGISSSDPFALPLSVPPGPLTVSGYLPVEERLEERLADLRRRLDLLVAEGVLPAAGITVRWVEEAEWADAWKAHFQPFRVGRRLVVKPTWQPWEGKPEDLVIELDPGMAFGSGLHATTRMCLELLEDYLHPGDRVLDWGTGSGILALAASRLGAGEVMALDLDPVAVRTARANVEASGLSSAIWVREGSLESLPAEPAFDLITANLVADPLIAGARELAVRLRSGGISILSGIIDSREAEVVEAAKAAGLMPGDRREEADWRALLFWTP